MKHFFLSVMILSVIVGITACKKENNSGGQNDKKFPMELIKTWKLVSVNGKVIVTDSTMILQIKNKEDANIMERLVYDDVPVWQNMRSVVSYGNDTLKFTGNVDNPFKRIALTFSILELTNDRLRMKVISEFENGNLKPNRMGYEFVFESVPSNKDAKIHGMWKTTPSYTDDPFGLYFKKTGDYDYFYGGTQIKSNNEGFYWFYGNFMVLRYKNTHHTNDMEEYVECWNVKIVETTDETNPKTMTFTALREDGKTETVTFSFSGTGIF